MKIFYKTVLSVLSLGFFIFLAFGSTDSDDKSDNNKSKVICDSSNDGYKKGYESGKESVWGSPEEFIRNCNNGHGMIGEVPSCWHEGFRDAKKSSSGSSSTIAGYCKGCGQSYGPYESGIIDGYHLVCKPNPQTGKSAVEKIRGY